MIMVFDFPCRDLPLLTIMVFIFKYLNWPSLIISCLIMSCNKAVYLSGMVQVPHFLRFEPSISMGLRSQLIFPITFVTASVSIS